MGELNIGDTILDSDGGSWTVLEVDKSLGEVLCANAYGTCRLPTSILMRDEKQSRCVEEILRENQQLAKDKEELIEALKGCWEWLCSQSSSEYQFELDKFKSALEKHK